MLPLGQLGYTDEEVLDALRAKHGTRYLSFRYDLLDQDNTYLSTLGDIVESCTISQSYFADIKRTAKFTIRDTGDINFLSDRIQPWVRLSMPPLPVGAPSTYSGVLSAVASPFLHYTFDDPSGSTIADNTGSAVGQDLTVHGSGMPAALGLVEGSSFLFTPASDNYATSATAGDQLDNKTELTVVFWFKATTNAAVDYLVDSTDGSNNGGFSVAKTSANRLQIYLNLTTGKINAITPTIGGFGADQVFQVIITWKTGVGMKLFVNNEEIALTHSGIANNSVGVIANQAGLKVGGWWNDATPNSANLLSGWLDDLAFLAKYIGDDEDTLRNLYLAGIKSGRYAGNNYVEWPQGVFLLTSPSRKSDPNRMVSREVEAYDQLIVLSDDKVVDRFTVPVGDLYTDAISAILGSMDKNIESSTLTLPVAMEWEPGTSKLSIINDLLSAINYQSLFFDEYGQAIVTPYVSPTDRPPEFVYADDADSVTLPEVDQTIDLFSVANKWVLVVSDADRPALRSELTNDDPASLTSTVSRGRTIVDYRTESDAADQTTLDDKVARLAIEASQVFEEIDFNTALMPIHSHNDVYTFSFSNLVIDDKYAETAWEMTLAAGQSMKHTVRKVVSLNV
jgi:hypothetical protein